MTSSSSCPTGFVRVNDICKEGCRSPTLNDADWESIQIFSFVVSVIGCLLIILVISLWLRDKERRKQYLVITFSFCSCAISVITAITSMLPMDGYFCASSKLANSINMSKAPSACVIQAVLLVYFAYCAAMSWVVIGVDLFIKVVLSKATKNMATIYLILIFSIPLIPVLGTLNAERYGFNGGLPWCGFENPWQGRYSGNKIDIFIVPASAILFVGLVAMLFVIFKIFRIQWKAPKTISSFRRSMTTTLESINESPSGSCLHGLQRQVRRMYCNLAIFMDHQLELFKPFRTPTTFICTIFAVWSTIIAARVIFDSDDYESEISKWKDCIAAVSPNGSVESYTLDICGSFPKAFSVAFLYWIVFCVSGQSIFISLVYLPNVKFDVLNSFKRFIKPSVMLFVSIVYSDKKARKRMEVLLAETTAKQAAVLSEDESDDDSSVCIVSKPRVVVSLASPRASAGPPHSMIKEEEGSYGSAPLRSSSSSSGGSDESSVIREDSDLEIDFFRVDPIQDLILQESNPTDINHSDKTAGSDDKPSPRLLSRLHQRPEPMKFLGFGSSSGFSVKRSQFGVKMYRQVGKVYQPLFEGHTAGAPNVNIESPGTDGIIAGLPNSPRFDSSARSTHSARGDNATPGASKIDYDSIGSRTAGEVVIPVLEDDEVAFFPKKLSLTESFRFSRDESIVASKFTGSMPGANKNRNKFSSSASKVFDRAEPDGSNLGQKSMPKMRVFSRSINSRILPERHSCISTATHSPLKKVPYSHSKSQSKWPTVNIHFKESSASDQEIIQAINNAFGIASTTSTDVISPKTSPFNSRKYGASKHSPKVTKAAHFTFNFDSSDQVPDNREDLDSSMERGKVSSSGQKFSSRVILPPISNSDQISPEITKLSQSPTKIRSFRKIDNPSSPQQSKPAQLISAKFRPQSIASKTTVPPQPSKNPSKASYGSQLSSNRSFSMFSRLGSAGKFFLRALPQFPLERIDSCASGPPSANISIRSGHSPNSSYRISATYNGDTQDIVV